MGAKTGKTVGVYERPPKSRRTLYLAIAIAVLLVIAGLFFFSQPASASQALAARAESGDLAGRAGVPPIDLMDAVGFRLGP